MEINMVFNKLLLALLGIAGLSTSLYSMEPVCDPLVYLPGSFNPAAEDSEMIGEIQTVRMNTFPTLAIAYYTTNQ
jgi:hypothetical protein